MTPIEKLLRFFSVLFLGNLCSVTYMILCRFILRFAKLRNNMHCRLIPLDISECNMQKEITKWQVLSVPPAKLFNVWDFCKWLPYQIYVPHSYLEICALCILHGCVLYQDFCVLFSQVPLSPGYFMLLNFTHNLFKDFCSQPQSYKETGLIFDLKHYVDC